MQPALRITRGPLQNYLCNLCNPALGKNSIATL